MGIIKELMEIWLNEVCHNSFPLSVELERYLEFEVIQILDSKWDRWRKDPLLYYVCWAGYEGTSKEYLWLTTADLENATDLIEEFHRLNPNKPGPSTTTRD